MSHRDDCPDKYTARRQGNQVAGYGDWTSRYSNPYSGYDGCPEAAREWERGYEARKEQMAEEASAQRRADARRQEEEYAQQQYEEEYEQQRQMDRDYYRQMEQDMYEQAVYEDSYSDGSVD